MKGIVFCLLGLLIGVESSGQLVRRKDYDLAVALQAGGGTSVGIPFRDVRMFVVPVGGLKMTIPFTRKWFWVRKSIMQTIGSIAGMPQGKIQTGSRRYGFG